MKNQSTLANINLYAVLRNIEDLCELDKHLKSLSKKNNISVEFSVKNGPIGYFTNTNGKYSFNKGPLSSCDIRLFFNSPEHFNNMINGNGLPIPVKGLRKLGAFKDTFLQITNRLSFYLKPTDELLKDNRYMLMNTILTAYTAFYALKEISSSDYNGRQLAKKMKDGTINIYINQGPSVCLKIQNGTIDVFKEAHSNPTTEFIISNMKTANDLLNGKTDFYKCITNQSVKIKGDTSYVSPLDALLNIVKQYLK